MVPSTRRLFNLEACFLLGWFQSGWCTVLADGNQNFSDVWFSSGEINDVSRKPSSGRVRQEPAERGAWTVGPSLRADLAATPLPPLLRTVLRPRAPQHSAITYSTCVAWRLNHLVAESVRARFRSFLGWLCAKHVVSGCVWADRYFGHKARRAIHHNRAPCTEEGKQPETQPRYRQHQPGQRACPVLSRSPRANLSRDRAESLVKCQQVETLVSPLTYQSNCYDLRTSTPKRRQTAQKAFSSQRRRRGSA